MLLALVEAIDCVTISINFGDDESRVAAELLKIFSMMVRESSARSYVSRQLWNKIALKVKYLACAHILLIGDIEIDDLKEPASFGSNGFENSSEMLFVESCL